MSKATGIILGLFGAGLIYVHYKSTTAGPVNNGPANNNNNQLVSNPGATLNYTDLPGDEQNAGFTDLSNIAGYPQCLAFLQATDRTSLFRSAWLLISDWVDYTPHVTLAQIALYTHGDTPDTIYAAQSDAFTTIAAVLQEKANPVPPSLKGINWTSPPQAVLYFLTGYQFLNSADIDNFALAAKHANLTVDQLLLQQCFSQNKCVWEYLSLVSQLIPGWQNQNTNINNTNQGGPQAPNPYGTELQLT
jgi:hypothetical protein